MCSSTHSSAISGQLLISLNVLVVGTLLEQLLLLFSSLCRFFLTGVESRDGILLLSSSHKLVLVLDSVSLFSLYDDESLRFRGDSAFISFHVKLFFLLVFSSVVLHDGVSSSFLLPLLFV